MREAASRRRLWSRLAAALFGGLLLAHLIRRAGPAQLFEGVAAVGWGLLLVIALAVSRSPCGPGHGASPFATRSSGFRLGGC